MGRSPVTRLQAGFTYLWLLFAVAIMGVALAAAGSFWHIVQKREKERELLYIGNQYRQAIGLYYEKSPGGVKRYPKTLEDLLADSRYVTTQRYLRAIYRDPITSSKNWGLVEGPGGTIRGVYSLSEDTPIKTGNFSEQDKEFENAEKYADWKFVYQANQQATTPPSTAPTGGAGQPAAAPAPSLPTNVPGLLK